jgi:dinuclear metal center YbgI/SA1388 family protein
MLITEIVDYLETLAHPTLQEDYDNTGLLTGSKEWNCTGILISLDATEEVILEAKEKGCNLVIAHHPIIFSGLKRIAGVSYVEKAIISSIKNDIAIYAIHTNLDNVLMGVNGKMAEKIGLINCRILKSKKSLIKKLFTFVPLTYTEAIRSAIFTAGAGEIGNYSECSFNATGTGTFKAGEGTKPFVGEQGKRHEEDEMKIEVIFPAWKENAIVSALKRAHPYEEVAYDVIQLDNEFQTVGSGIIGELETASSENAFLDLLKTTFNLQVVRHTSLLQKPIKKVAICGGAGSFLTKTAIAAGADVFVTADVKYHEFFDAENRLLLTDIGHWESEQFTIDLLAEELSKKFPTFAVLKTGVKTNPVAYYI